MAIVIDPKDEQAVLALAGEENLEATNVAVVTDTGRMRLFWRGKCIVDIERAFLNTNGAAQYAAALVQSPDIKSLLEDETEDNLRSTLLKLLGDLNICSQKGLIERFDSTIGALSVNMPLGGKRQLTPNQAMAALVPVLGGVSFDATIMSYGLDPYLMERSPFHGAVYSVFGAIAKLAAAGGNYQNAWLTLQEYFESLGGDPCKWGKPVAALLGAMYAQAGLGVAAIGGKDSMSGTFRDISVPPTLCAFALSVEDAKTVLSPEFKNAGDGVYLLDLDTDQLSLPVFEMMKPKYEAFHVLVREGKVKAAYAVEQGGILAAVTKMAMETA